MQYTSGCGHLLMDECWDRRPELDMFLERSRHNLLEISVDESTDPNVAVHNFSKLEAHINRWYSLDITTSSREDCDMLTAPLYTLCAPKLEHIRIACFADDLDAPSTTRIFAGGTPSLKTVRLCTIACFPYNLGTVTHFKYHNLPGKAPLLTYTMFCQLISTMHSLALLSLTGDLVSSTTQIVRAINLPSLRSPFIRPVEDFQYEESIFTSPDRTSTLCATLAGGNLEHFALATLTPALLPLIYSSLAKEGIPPFPSCEVTAWSRDCLPARDHIIMMQVVLHGQTVALIDCESDGFLSVLLQQSINSTSESHLWPHLHISL